MFPGNSHPRGPRPNVARDQNSPAQVRFERNDTRNDFSSSAPSSYPAFSETNSEVYRVSDPTYSNINAWRNRGTGHDGPSLPQTPDNAELTARNTLENSQYRWNNGDAHDKTPATPATPANVGGQAHAEGQGNVNTNVTEDRRGSDNTLTDVGGENSPEKPANAKINKGTGSGTERARANRNDFPVPPSNPYQQYRDTARDIESHNKKPGFFGRIGKALKNFAADQEVVKKTRPANYLARTNSWAGNMLDGRAPQNNFEESLALNAPEDETYLYREDNSDPAAPNRTPNMQSLQRRMSYAERRKVQKHVIKYCAEGEHEYERFILTFARSLLVFGSPSHRIEAQLNSLAKVFNLEAQFLHSTGTVQVSFGNLETKGSVTCLVKAPVGLALGRIHSIHNIYRYVLHDEMPASEGTSRLKELMEAEPRYSAKKRFLLQGLCCFLICGIAFGGSLNDMWVAGVLGMLVKLIQTLANKSNLSASGSEIFTAAVVSFIARGLSSFHTNIWCYTAISDSGVISLLPGFLILAGALDIAGKNIALGAPKIVSGIMTSLYLGFGLTFGSDVFLFVDKSARVALDSSALAASAPTVIEGSFTALNGTAANNFFGTFSFTNTSAAVATNVVNGCYRDPNWEWYLQPIPWWSLFFCVPLFAFFGSMNNQQHWYSRQMFVMVFIACISFLITRLANLKWGLANHPDYTALLGSTIIGLLGNGYSRRFGGTAFTVMLTGVLLLVPDGLSAAGGLTDAYTTPGQDEYTQSLSLALKMVSVVIGIMAGVYISAAIVYFFGKKKNAALVTF